MQLPIHDVAVIGGGPAGLSAALVFSRAGRQVAVVDSGAPRNAASPGVHGFLSRDGTLPSTLKEIAREQIAAYGTVTFVETVAESLQRKGPEGFELELRGAEPLRARSVLLALGMVDVLPVIPGLVELWGRDVIHCAFCHGAEHRGRAWGLIAPTAASVETAHRLLHWTDDLIVFADPDLPIDESTSARLCQHGIRIVREPLEALTTNAAGRLTTVKLGDGSEIARDTLVYQPMQRQTRFVYETGVDLVGGRVWVTEGCETSVSGLFAAGDLTAGHQDVASAVASGAMAAKRITQRLADQRC